MNNLLDNDSKILSLADLANKNNSNNNSIDNSIFDCDLNSLAEKYQNNQQQQQPFQLSLTFSNQNQNSEEILSSSIDRLLNSFFSSNFESNLTLPTSSNPIVIDFSLDDTLKSETSMSDGGGGGGLNKSKSITINNNKDTSENVQIESNNMQTFSSLSDLANEYLANNMTPSSTTNFLSNNTPFEENLVDLIDNEFNQRFSLTEDSNLVDFSANKLVIKKDKKISSLTESRLSSSLTCSSTLSNLVTTTNNLSSLSLKSCDLNDKKKRSLANISNMEKLQDFEFIKQVKPENEQTIKNIYLISDSSKFSSFFAESSGSSAGGGGGDDEFEEKFSYSKQVEYYNKQHEISLGKRKRFIIDANKRDYVKKSITNNNKQETLKFQNNKFKKTQITNENSSTTISQSSIPSLPEQNDELSSNNKLTVLNNSNHRVKTTSISKSKSKVKTKANIAHREKPIQVFDFSIPSPDDIVIAKQKFAFKNMRFKP
jgi:hypothetical protein